MKNGTLFPIRRFFLSICLIFGLSSSLLAQEADFVSTPSSVNVNPSETFSVVIQVQINSGEISGAETHLDFNTALLQVSSIDRLSAAELPTEVVGPPSFNNTNGTIDYVAGALGGNNATASFDFIRVNFTAVAVGDTFIAYNLAFPRETKITAISGNVLGSAANIPVEITAANQDPVASFIATPTSGTAQLLVDVDASASTDDGTIASYDWNFGDGNIGTGMTASNNYLNQGNYTITLTVTDDDGAMDSTTENIVVNEVVITTYTITATAGDNGTIDPETATINAGSNQTFTITPNSGYEVADVLVNGFSEGAVDTYEFINLQANSTISASFSEIPPFQLCIASGSAALTAFGRAFEQDNGSTGAAAHPTRTNGKKFGNFSDPIAGTTPGSGEELLFQKEIWGGAGGNNPSYTYDIPVADGFYKVDLYFAEVFHSTTSKRIFDVLLEGNVILDEYEIVDPIKDGISTFQTAITRTYYVNVQDGSLQVGIGPASVDNGKLSGLCVTAVESANVHPITNIGALDFDALVAVAQPLNITDADELAISFSGMPASLTYNPTNNQLEGTPTIAEVGTYTINAIISDGTNSPVTEEFELVINPPVGDDPPTIVAIPNVEINEGGTVDVAIQVNDDNTAEPTASIIIYDKSEPGGSNNPFTPAGIVPEADYTFASNGAGSYTLTWITDTTDGRSYEARVTGNDGSFSTESTFTIDVAQDITEIIPARTFSAPLPWYGGSPGGAAGQDFSVAIEDLAAQNLGWVDNMDFVEYFLNIPSAGTYNVRFNAAKGSGGNTTITISDEIQSVGTVTIPQSPTPDRWNNYFDQTTSVTFANAGLQRIRLDFNGGANISEIEFTPIAGSAAPVITLDATATVDEGDNLSVPLTISDTDGDNLTVTFASMSTEPQLLQTSNDGKQVDPFPFDADGFFTQSNVNATAGSYAANLDFSPIFGDGGGANGDGNGTYNITVTVDDGNGNVISQDLMLTVTDIAQIVSGTLSTRIEAESFDNQGPPYVGVGNVGIGVEIDPLGFTNIGYSHVGDFVEYEIDVQTAGLYAFNMLVSDPGAVGVLTSKVMDISSTAGGSTSFTMTGTGNYGNYVVQSINVNFEAGPQTLKFEWTGGGGGFLFNMDYFDVEFISAANNPPTIAAIANVEINEGETVSVDIQVTDDNIADPTASIIIYDKSVTGGTNNPFTPAGIVAAADYAFDDNGSGSFTLTWITDTTDGRSYEARVSTNDGVNPSVESRFAIDVAQSIDETILARTFNNPLPWYGGNPQGGFTVAIETAGNIGWIGPGEFTEYLIDVPTAGVYDFTIYGANNSGSDTTVSILEEDNSGNFNELGTVEVLFNGDWEDFIAYTTPINFVNSGLQTIRLSFNGGANVTEFEFTEVVNAIPVVTITVPTDNINVSRGSGVTLTGTAIDEEDDDISELLAWSSSDTQFASTPVNGIGANITAQFVTPGTQTVRASVADSGGETAFDEITVNVMGPQVAITSPTDGEVVASTNVTLEWSSTDVLFGLQEHFHIFVNPADVSNINTDFRISTAPQIGQLFWDLTAIEGIVEGENTIVIRAANQFHEEFTNSEAEDIVTFTVCSTTITSVTPTNPTTCGGVEGELSIVATGTNLEYSINNGDFFQASGDFSDLAAGTYNIVVRENGTTNCDATSSAVLVDPMDPMPTISGPLTYLEGSGGVTLDAGPGWASYLWSPGSETTQTITATEGTYTVTVVNANGCDGTSIGVVVTETDDSTPPEAVCQNIEVMLDATGNASITAEQIDNGSNDISGIASLSINIETFTCADLGDIEVMLIVEDNNGNISNCTATVTVIDEIAPMITCPADVSMTVSAPQVLQIDPATAVDNCDNAIMITFERLDNPSLGLDAAFPIGQTTIQWTALDASGNMDTCVQTVTLTMAQSMSNDIIAFSVPAQIGAEVIDAGAKTVDLTVALGTDVSALAPNIQISSMASISPNTGVEQDFSNPIMYTVTAENGTQQQWTVTVIVEADTTAPTLVSLSPLDDTENVNSVPMPTATFDEPIQWASGGVITITDLDDMTTFGTLSEALGGPIDFVGNTIVIDPMQPFTAGHEYSIEIPSSALVDAAGNPFAGIPANGWTFTIFEDTTPPEITCPTNIVVSNDLGECGAIVTYTVTSDGELIMTDGFESGAMFPKGTTTVSYQATGANGIMANCSFDVTVNDTELPTISCVSNITVQAAMGTSFMVVDYLAPGFGDNCPGASIIQIAGLASGSEFPAGTTTNTFEVTDESDNKATCSFNVTVESGTVGDTELTVLDATTDTPLFNLVDGMVIQKSVIGETPLGVIFNTDFDPRGVSFILTGPVNERRYEGPAPHSLFGDVGVNINGKPFPVGSYTLIANPFLGPTITVNFSIVDVDPICANFNAQIDDSNGPDQCGGSNGNIAIQVSNAVLPLSYDWSHDANLNSATASGLSASTYTVTVTDGNGCSDTITTTLSDPDKPIVSLSAFADILDSASAFALNGGSPAGGTYSGTGVSNGMFTPSVAGVYPITYSYTSPSTGCMGSATRTIRVISTAVGNSQLTVLDARTDTPLFDLVDGMVIQKSEIGEIPLGVIFNTDFNPGGVFFALTGPINERRSEGPAPHSLFGDIGVNIQGKPFPVGDYTLVADPFVGPPIIVNFSVADTDPICNGMMVEVQSESDPTTCNGSNGSIVLNSTGQAPFDYNWSHDSSLESLTATGLSADTYTVTVTDANGCMDTVTTTLSDPTGPNVTLANLDDVMNTDELVNLSGGLPAGGSYSGAGVTNGVFDPSIGAGTYTITYSFTDAVTGCDGSASKSITVTTVNMTLLVTSYTLINADSDTDLMPLIDGMEINIDDLPTTNLDIRVNTSNDVESVRMTLSGALSRGWTENTAPFALFGNIGTDYLGTEFVAGSYSVSTTPYSLNSLRGIAGAPLTITFQLNASEPSFFLKQVKEMIISPNPASDVATIVFAKPMQVSNIFVYDVMGRLVKTYKGGSVEEVYSRQLEVQDLPSGIYFVKTKDVNGGELQQQMAIKR